jgi:hypothetical protein
MKRKIPAGRNDPAGIPTDLGGHSAAKVQKEPYPEECQSDTDECEAGVNPAHLTIGHMFVGDATRLSEAPSQISYPNDELRDPEGLQPVFEQEDG